MARTTSEVTLIADTEQKIISSPEENYRTSAPWDFTKKDAMETARDLLYKKAVKQGSDPGNMEIEVIESQEFNVVRKFSLQGKIFRIKIQIKPGLIRGFESMCRTLNQADET